jgi:hypothetical protein
MNDIDLINVARIGIDAEAFSKSDIGKFLIGKAQAEIEAATSELIAADPADVKANTEIRNKIHIARMFLVWLDEAIQVGRLAHDQLQEMDHS